MSYALRTDPHEVGFDASPDLVTDIAEALGCDCIDINVYDRSVILRPSDLARLLHSGDAIEFRRGVFAERVTIQAWFDGPDDEQWRLTADFLPGEEPS